MRHDHVLVGAGAFVEVRPLVQTEGFGNVDLDVVDEVAIPDRLEQAVGEAERQDVLGGFLAQKMVDAEDLGFVECLVQEVVEGYRTGQVGAERLLHHHSGLLDEISIAQRGDDGARCLRGDR